MRNVARRRLSDGLSRAEWMRGMSPDSTELSTMCWGVREEHRRQESGAAQWKGGTSSGRRDKLFCAKMAVRPSRCEMKRRPRTWVRQEKPPKEAHAEKEQTSLVIFVSAPLATNTYEPAVSIKKDTRRSLHARGHSGSHIHSAQAVECIVPLEGIVCLFFFRSKRRGFVG